MSKFEDATEKALKIKVTITRTIDEWRQLGELLENYKSLISSLHGSFLKDASDGDLRGKRDDLQNQLANQGMKAMQFETALMRDIQEASHQQVREVMEEALGEHKKAK